MNNTARVRKLTLTIIYFFCTFRCISALTLSWTPFISSSCFLFIPICFFKFFNKGFIVEERKKRTKKKQGEGRAKKTGRRRSSLSLCSLCENNWLISIYICNKTLSSIMLSLQKNSYFLSFHSSIYHSKLKHPRTFERKVGVTKVK